MYCIKRTVNESISYYKYDGWSEHVPYGQALDLSGVVLFTEGERKRIELPANEEFQWYGAYKR